MRHRLYLTPVFLMALSAPALVAQAPSAWFQVLHRPQDKVLVQARVVTVDGSPCIQFRNEGQDAINFSFSFNGEDPFTNPRIHINAHKRSPFLSLPVGVSGSNVNKLFMLRIGPDQGPVLSN